MRKSLFLITSVFSLVLCNTAYCETGTYYPSEDSYVNSSNENDGTWCEGSTVSIAKGNDETIAYINFNLSSVPAEVNITQATLRLYTTTIISNGNVAFALVSNPWAECQLTWADHPEFESPITQSQPSMTSSWWEIDVTAYVEKWIETGASNKGFRLDKLSDGVITFSSNESANSPELLVVYEPNTCTASGQVLSATDQSGLENILMTFNRISGNGAIPSSVNTDVHGNWSQAGFESDGTVYRVTPSHSNFEPFDPGSRDFSCSNPSNLDFSVPTSYSVTIESTPSGAAIRYNNPDNPVECYTPCTLTDLEGNEIIWLTLDGYESVEQVIGWGDSGTTISISLFQTVSITLSPPYEISNTSHTFTEYSSKWGAFIVRDSSDQDPHQGLVRNRSWLDAYFAGASSFSIDNRIMIPFSVPETGQYRITANGTLSGEINEAIGLYYLSIDDCRHTIHVGCRVSKTGGTYQEIFNNLDQPFPDEIQWMAENAFEVIWAFYSMVYNGDLGDILSLTFDALAEQVEFIHDLFVPAQVFSEIPLEPSFLVNLQANQEYNIELIVRVATIGGTSGGLLFTEVDVTAMFDQIKIVQDGTGTKGPILSVEPTWQVEFPSIEAGETSTINEAFVLTNIGDQHLNGTAVLETGPFAITSGATFSLDPDEQSTLNISFHSNEVGNYTKYLSFTGGGYSERLVSGTVFATTPQLSVLPIEEINFGEVLVGEMKEQIAFSVSNTGTGVLSGSVSVDLPFEIVSGGTFNLSQGESQPVDIRFTPSAEGEFSSNVGFDGAGGATRTVAGIGSIPQITTIHVPYDYPTIQEAINAAGDSSIVFVSSGVYHENIVINKGINLIGEDVNTTIIDSDSSGICIDIDVGTAVEGVVSGFTIINSGDGGVVVDAYPSANWTIDNNHIYNHLGNGILTYGKCTISNNLIALSKGGLAINSDSDVLVSNNLIYKNNLWGISIHWQAYNSKIVNNIIMDHTDFGISAFSNFFGLYNISYNNIFNNYWGAYNGPIAPDTGNIYTDPLLYDLNINDFRLYMESPCIDAGDPSPLFNDINNTRNDIGMFGGPKGFSYEYPVAIVASNIPNEYFLKQAYPNPFNPSTTISYSLPEQSTVKVIVFDIRGQEVMTLQETKQYPGNYEIQWNGLDQSDNPMSTGVYFARLEAGSYSQTIKMVYLK